MKLDKFISTDAADFLETLLWVNDGQEPGDDGETDRIDGATIYEFSRPFIDQVEGFLSGFRQFLTREGFDVERLDYLERSFGGNVFFSLSGHGCGFFDEYGDPEKTLGDELQALVEKFSGERYRFESLEYSIMRHENGEIDLSILPEFIAERRAALFSVAPVTA